MSAAGKVFLVGAGPGDAGLITVRGRECIEAASVIVYDHLVNPALLRSARPEAELIYAGKMANRHTLTQDEINQLLVQKAAEGQTVTRLKGGDPFVFGRGGEEAQGRLGSADAARGVAGLQQQRSDDRGDREQEGEARRGLTLDA